MTTIQRTAKPKTQRLVLIGAAVAALIGAGLLAAWGLRHQAAYFYVPSDIATAPPTSAQALAEAVSADLLLRQRALVLARLRQSGVDVLEAPYGQIGPRLIDAYLALRQGGEIG